MNATEGIVKSQTKAEAKQQGLGLLANLSELSKARLSFLVLMTTLVGFLLGWRGGWIIPCLLLPSWEQP